MSDTPKLTSVWTGVRATVPTLMGLMLVATGDPAPAAPAAPADTLWVRSGADLAPGAPDPGTTILVGPTNGTMTLTEASFSAARAGVHATVATGWDLYRLAFDPHARWVNNTGSHGSGATFLLAAEFELPSAPGEVTLDLAFAVDNAIGDYSQIGIYLNEIPLPSAHPMGDHDVEARLSWSSVSRFLRPGRNVLYLYTWDQGGPSGVIFSARFVRRPSPPRPTVDVYFVAPPVVRPDSTVMANLVIENNTGETQSVVPVLVRVPLGTPCEIMIPLQSPPPVTGLAMPTPGSIPSYVEDDRARTWGILIPRIDPGETIRIPFRFPPASPSHPDRVLEAEVRAGPSFGDVLGAGSTCVGKIMLSGIDAVLLVSGAPTPLQCLWALETAGLAVQEMDPSETWVNLWEFLGIGFSTVSSCVPFPLRVERYLEVINGGLWTKGVLEATDACQHFQERSNGYLRTWFTSSFDPNAKHGVAGWGSEHFVGLGEWLSYEVLFENLATATAPAYRVEIQDTLSSWLDPASVEIGRFAFGKWSTSGPWSPGRYSTYIDLRPDRDALVLVDAAADSTTGVVRMTLSAINPRTGALMNGPLDGFLPPNVHSPEGTGAISIRVRPRPDVPSGTRILNRASIVFDTNAPIVTDVWVNGIDSRPPSIHITEALGQSGRLDLRYSLEDDVTTVVEAWAVLRSDVMEIERIVPIDVAGDAASLPAVEGRYTVRIVALDACGNVAEGEPTLAVVSAPEQGWTAGRPYPNPFRRDVAIDLVGDVPEALELKVFDVAGRRVAVRHPETVEGGRARVEWDGRTANGAPASTGVYFIRIGDSKRSVLHRVVRIR